MALYTSVLQAGSNSFETTAEHLNNFAKDFLAQSGVVGAFVNNTGSGSTGAFGIDAQGTPNNTVSIRAGVAYILSTPSTQRSQMLRIEAQAAQTLTINSNTSGSTVYDWVYIKVDTTAANNPAVDSTDVSTIYVSRSTSSGSDTGAPPSTGLLLAVITVANGFSSITNGNISGKRVGAVFGTTAIKDNAVTAAKIEAQQSWQNAVYSNSWVDYDSGTTYGGVQYFKDSLGIVHLRGLAKSGTATIGTTMFTLPAGYRPGRQQLHTVTTNDVIGRVDVYPDGTVKTGAGVSNAYVSFVNISFRAEN